MSLGKTLAILSIIVAGCNARNNKVAHEESRTKPKTVASYDVDIVLTSRLHWVDSLTYSYAKASKNELIQVEVKTGREESWLWDQILITDTATFVVLLIGHSFESRFVTDGWLYVDTITRKAYEYDATGDSLIRWVPSSPGIDAADNGQDTRKG